MFNSSILVGGDVGNCLCLSASFTFLVEIANGVAMIGVLVVVMDKVILLASILSKSTAENC